MQLQFASTVLFGADNLTIKSCLFCLFRERIEKMSIARRSELLKCDSALSKHARGYFAHPLNLYPQRLKKFSTSVHFQLRGGAWCVIK